MAAAAESARTSFIQPPALGGLRASVRGAILTPDAEGYDQSRTGWNLCGNHSPALVVKAVDEADVVAAVNFAQRQRLGIAVQGTGHGFASACSGVLVNTSAMKRVTIDPVAQTARVEPGVVWSEVIEQAQRFGLAPLSGSSPDVGVLGYTLGGGTGWLARRYGYAADSLVSADIVLADGRLVRASDVENADLFWALRGGGGNFGAVTALEFRLYPVSEFYGGGIYFAIEDAATVLAAYRDWIRTAPETVSSRFAFLNVPPLPFIPAPIRGRWVLAIQACFLGTEAQGVDLFSPFRSVAAPLLDGIRMMPYSAIGTVANDPKEPQAMVIGTELLNDIPAALVDGIMQVVGAPSSAIKLVEVRHLGGAIAKLPESASAVGHRKAGFWINTIASAPDPATRGAVLREVARIGDAVEPWTTGGVLLNGLDSNSAHRVPEAYSQENYSRLVGLKRKYDPGNLFRYNLNISPFERVVRDGAD